MSEITQDKIRNVAIIAHVDHGKTTLVDAFLKQTHVFRDNQAEMQGEAILDSGDLEREKGITITAKTASIYYKGYKINIIDTPGHADFGGEVERTLNMAEGCLLVVDAQEGPMPQTKFVLRKALENGLKPVVVINKIDKQHADPGAALEKVNDLFLNLVQDAEQLDFPVYYASGREGKAFAQLPESFTNLEQIPGDITPLFDGIISNVPAPAGDSSGTLQMLVTTLDYHPHLGRLLVGKISRGGIKVKDQIVVVHGPEPEAAQEKGQVKVLMVREGLDYKEVESATTGEVVAIAGVDSFAIGGTVNTAGNIDPLPRIQLTPPSVQAKFEASTSPFVGRDGKFVTAKQLQQRLEKEKELNIGLNITQGDGGGYIVAGRGEMQLAILIEELRREGYEFQVRRPEVVLKEENGVLMEPLEELFIEVPEEYQGSVITTLGERGSKMLEMETSKGLARLTYTILTRNLLGLRNTLLPITKGSLVMSNIVIDYVPYDKSIAEPYRKGVLIASETGVAAAYALNTIQERGELFITPATEVYEGMIIGINKYEQDMEVNVAKEREKSGVRRNQAEITQIALKSPVRLSLEFALVFIANDELLEVTPSHLRLRKQHLTKNERVWSERQNLSHLARQKLGS